MSASRPTLRAVAARAGVAPSTASLILRSEGRFARATVDKVLAVAAQMGYEAGTERALPLLPGSTGVAGVATYTPVHGIFRDGHSQDVVRGLHRTLEQHSMALLLLPPVHSHHFDEAFAGVPLDMMFLLTTPHDTSAVRAAAKARGVPVAHLESGGPAAPPPMVVVDDLPPMREVAAHLRALGHTCIASVTLRMSAALRSGLVVPPPLKEIENPITRARLEGLALGGLTPRYVYETAHSLESDGTEAAKVLMRLDPRPTAIVCQTDTLAQGVLAGLREIGVRVPEDVSVTGYDATDVPSLAPGRLTSVLQDGVLKGELLAKIGIAMSRGLEVEPARLETFFVEGTTTGPAPR